MKIRLHDRDETLIESSDLIYGSPYIDNRRTRFNLYLIFEVKYYYSLVGDERYADTQRVARLFFYDNTGSLYKDHFFLHIPLIPSETFDKLKDPNYQIPQPPIPAQYS